ncbi:MAG TPA: hypothetical protein VH744_05650 [Terriglobales bacterium]|jgi:hypothetical protein
MRLAKGFLCLSILLFLPGVAKCQQPTLNDPLLDALIGKWVLTGDITGQQTTHDVDVQWVLNHQFISIHEISREKTPEALPQYEAHVYIGWDAKKNQYVVHWIDVFGGGFASVGYAPKDKSSIAMIFKSEDGDFHTTFTFDQATNTWQWTMDSEQNGKLHAFARLKMSRQK